MEHFQIEASFPTVITPKKKGLQLQELFRELPNFKPKIEQLLLSKGALLFHGFPFKTSDEFATFIETLKFGDFVNYILGDSPRNKVKNKVYTSTEVPAPLQIHLHQELSYVKSFPRHIYFFCQTAPEYQGETLIADARNVYRSLNKDVVDRFQEKGLIYTSHYYSSDKFMEVLNRFARSHKSWMEVFETQSKSMVEKICCENEIDFRWLPKDWIEINQSRPALLKHPITHETVWFNQAHLYDFNPKLLGFLSYLLTKIIYFRPSTCLHAVTFGDGSRIPRKDLYHILEVLEENTVAHPWQNGDVMVLDNILTMHGRAPFKGERRILTALTI